MIRFSWPVLLAGALLALSCQKEPARELPEPEKPVVMDGSHKGPAAVFIGDSITWQWEREGVGHPTFFSSNNYVNKGISGNKTTEMEARFQKDAIDLVPYCVVIEGGTNDIAAFTSANILERIKKMAEMARKAHIDVVVGSVPPSNSFPKLPDFRPEDRIIELNGMIKQWADSEGIPYADYYSVLVDDEKGLKKAYQRDTVHPNATGYTAMEGVIQPILKKVLSAHIK